MELAIDTTVSAIVDTVVFNILTIGLTRSITDSNTAFNNYNPSVRILFTRSISAWNPDKLITIDNTSWKIPINA